MTSRSVPTALRQRVIERAGAQCEYCRIPEDITFAAHQIDHILAIKHGGTSSLDNLALSCVLCNKHKGSDIASIDPVTGEVQRLFDPRHDSWGEHFELDLEGEIIPLTAAGRVTVRLLQLNQAVRVRERQLFLL